MKNWDTYDKLFDLVWKDILKIFFYAVLALFFHFFKQVLPITKLMDSLFWCSALASALHTMSAVFIQVKIFKLEK